MMMNIKLIGFTVALCALFLGSSRADSLASGFLAGENITASNYLIAIGLRACQRLIRSNCSICIGDDSQLPDGADHLLAIGNAEPIHVNHIGPKLLNRIDTEYMRVSRETKVPVTAISRSYIDEWNKACQ